MAFRPAPACHVTPPTTEIKTNCLERVETEQSEPQQTNSAVVGGGGWALVLVCHFQRGFVISTFPPRADEEGLSPSLPSPCWVLGWPLSAGSPCSPSPAHPRHPKPHWEPRETKWQQPGAPRSSPKGLPASGARQSGQRAPQAGQLQAGMVCPALPHQPWGGDAGMRGRLPAGRCRAWGARAMRGPASAASPTGEGRVLPAAPR